MSLRQPLRLVNSHIEALVNYVRLSSTAKAVRKERLTYLSSAKMLRLEVAVQRVLEQDVPGNVVEFGVALGGSAIVLARHARRYGRKFDGFDVFGMIPPPSYEDDEISRRRFETIASGAAQGIKGDEYYGYKKGLYEEVCSSFQRYGLPVDKSAVDLHKGLFADTLFSYPECAIAFAHVDCDWYDPVKLCLLEVAKRSSVGTVIVLDDFNDWSGCRKAALEFLQSNPEYQYDSGPNAILRRVS